MNQNIVLPNNDRNQEVKEGFNFANVCFIEVNNGKIKCGICQIECIRLMSHLNGSKKCSQYLNMEKLKTEFTNYKARQSRRRYEAKQKATNLESFKANANKRKRELEERQKAKDLESFKAKASKRQRDLKARQKAKDLESFTAKVNKKKKDQETKQKADDLRSFRENANKRQR